LLRATLFPSRGLISAGRFFDCVSSCFKNNPADPSLSL
jgi:hypothetical protein